jgi:hypothetical protein
MDILGHVRLANSTMRLLADLSGIFIGFTVANHSVRGPLLAVRSLAAFTLCRLSLTHSLPSVVHLWHNRHWL